MFKACIWYAHRVLNTHFLRLTARDTWKRGDFLVSVNVRDNNVEQALRVLKKKMQREGIFREMKMRKDFEKPSEKRKREKAEAVRRSRKMDRKRNEKFGY